MYRFGKQIHKHRRGKRTIVVVLMIGMFALLVYWLMHLRIAPTATIQSSPPSSKNYDSATQAKITVTKPEFTVQLPTGWLERKVTASPTGPRYTFSAPTPQTKILDIYIDNPPTNMAINNAIVVSTQGDGLTHDRVSDNCTTYTDPKSKNVQTGNAPARWQEIDFICDMGNVERQVVGIISHDGMNQVKVTGPSGTHKVFMTYTDNKISPDYTILYDILNDIHFK